VIGTHRHRHLLNRATAVSLAARAGLYM
jgi:hypothetical protein